MTHVVVVGGGPAGLNILTKERGEHFHGFDTPDDAADAFGTGEE